MSSNSNRIFMLDVNEPLIAVVAGSMWEVAAWKDSNIIPVTGIKQLDQLRGIDLTRVYEVGTWHKWLSPNNLQILQRQEGEGK